jgi:hypothetical protein
MGIREQNLETAGATYLTFAVNQSAGVNDLADADIGSPVSLAGNYSITAASDGSSILGKLISLSLTDADAGKRRATVQVRGVMTFRVAEVLPEIGNALVGAAGATVKQAPALAGNDPAGGNIARGTVIAVNGTDDCTVLL